MIKKITYSLLIFAIIGCKSSKNIAVETKLNPNMKAKQVFKFHNKNIADFSTLQAKLRVELTEKDKSQAHTLSLRMERDKVIWVNAFLNMVRIKITPQEVLMYNKLNKTFFKGDFSLINEFLGFNLSFDHLQNLLLANIILTYKPNDLERQHHQKSYALSPKRQHPLFEILYLINPENFKVDGVDLFQAHSQRTMQVAYSKFQTIDDQVFPQQINVHVKDLQEDLTLDVNLKSITLNQPLRFPFKLPAGYKSIKL